MPPSSTTKGGEASKDATAKTTASIPWRSNLCTPFVHGFRGTTRVEDPSMLPIQDTERCGIRVPRDGWYGFCFGRRDQSAKHSATSLLEPPHYHLVVQLPTTSTSKHHPQQQSWPLPLNHEISNNKKQKKFNNQATSHLISIQVGKLLFLQENSTVLVVRDHGGVGEDTAATTTGRDKPHQLINENQNIAIEMGETSANQVDVKENSSPFQWCLVEAPGAVRHDNDNKQDSKQKQIVDALPCQSPSEEKESFKSSVIAPTLVDATTATTTNILMHPSRLICLTCVRSFGTIHAVLCHAHEAHPVTPPQRYPTSSSYPSSPSVAATTDTNNTIWTRPLRVMFEDESMAVVVKPQGMAVMGSMPSLCRSNLLAPFQKIKQTKSPASSENKKKPRLECNDNQLDEEDWLKKPVPVHRLDAPTGGLLVIAKTKTAERQLKQSFATQTCQKRYRALLDGKLYPREGDCHEPMNGGKPTHTRYKVIEYYKVQPHHDLPCSMDQLSTTKNEGSETSTRENIGPCATANEGRWSTMVDLYPKTGRKHQLRKHMKALGHPILGDARYGNTSSGRNAISGPTATTTMQSPSGPYPTMILPSSNHLYLWAMELTLPHPISGIETNIQMEFPPPDWPTEVLKDELESG